MASQSLEAMLQTDYLDVPTIITGKQMLAVYNEQPEAQQAVITQAFDRSIASCRAFHEVPADESA